MERLQVDVDPVTAAYLRRRCVDRGGLADAAASALHQLAVADAVEALSGWSERHADEVDVLVEDGDTALAEAV